MNKEQLYEAIGEVSEAHVADARSLRAKKRPIRFSWLAAACLVLVAAAAIPYLAKLTNPHGGPGQQDPLRPLHVLEFNGAYYEALDMEQDRKTLDQLDLPHEITGDMVGDCLGPALDSKGRPTEEVFFLYTPYAHIRTESPLNSRAQRAVYVVQDTDGNYTFALFCNFVSFDGSGHADASELLAVYGIDEAADIAAIQFGLQTITHPDRIQAIFDAVWTSTALGNDDFQNLIYSGLSEEEQQALSKAMAKDSLTVRITTTEGLVTGKLLYHPSISCLVWGVTYLKLDPPLN